MTGIRGASAKTEGIGLMGYEGQVSVGRSADEDDTTWSFAGAGGAGGAGGAEGRGAV
ncbi:hypothetical protein NGM37_39815 [Streptomyces sp. TRM76130]|nr:hypothetical protein [Streptomyces sp. TRM76130]